MFVFNMQISKAMHLETVASPAVEVTSNVLYSKFRFNIFYSSASVIFKLGSSSGDETPKLFITREHTYWELPWEPENSNGYNFISVVMHFMHYIFLIYLLMLM